MYIYFFFLAHLDWNRHRRVHFFSVRLLIVNFSIPVECDWSGGRCFVELLLPPSINTWICPLSHISHTIYRIYIFVNYNNNKWEPGTVMNRCSPFTWHESLRFTERREKKIESKQLKMKSDQKFVFFSSALSSPRFHISSCTCVRVSHPCLPIEFIEASTSINARLQPFT